MQTIVAYYPDPARPDLIEQLQNALPPNITVVTGDAPPPQFHAFVGWHWDEDLFAQHPELRWIMQPSAGVNSGLREGVLANPNMSLHNMHFNAQATAEFAVGLLYTVAKFIIPIDQALRQGDWLTHWKPLQAIQLAGKRAVVLGFGEIGQRVGGMLKGVGMEVLGVKRSAESNQKINEIPIHPITSLHQLLPQADVLMVCLPLTAETTGMLNAETLALLPARSLLVNVGRAKLIDEQALYETLRDKKIHGAGLDVWYTYPENREDGSVVYPSQYPFHELTNVVMTPHRGGLLMAGENDGDVIATISRLLIAAANGDPVPNKVNLAAGY